MAVVVDDAPEGVIAFWNSTTWYCIEITGKEISDHVTCLTRATNHAAQHHLTSKADTALFHGSWGLQEIPHR